ncbi:hypothetical protein ASC61_10400 [Aeromicrobium sp. Root344]|nr:hypothetical protein ASC61_10400 [Aeromicrobium sp. Root344]
MVVVTVTYRLGVLGHYHPDDHTGPSPATTDQTTAIEWVHRHIQELGGDPNRITLVGQSAGASSIEVMLRWGLGPHVTGAILQSGNLCDPSISRSLVQAREHSASFDVLMKSVDPRGLPVSALLQYQDEFTRLNAGPTWAPARPDIEQPLDLALLGGWNTDDDLPFTVMSHNLDALTWHHRELLEAQAHADTASLYAEPTLEALGESYANGRPAWAYQFTWSAPGSPWGACHCIEIPFVLGAQYAWRHAPMLHGVPSDQLETYGRQMRQAWAEFARHANPGGEWRPWTPHEGAINLVPDLWGEV